MPAYQYSCQWGHLTSAVRKIAERHDSPSCQRCSRPTELRITPTMVSSFEPYRTVAHDKERGPLLIKNRAEHEAYLRRNGFEEIGNDKSMAPPSPEEIRHIAEQNVSFNYDPDTQEATR